MDSLLLKERAMDGYTLCLLAVCDGVGSLRDGAIAAGYAVRLLRSWMENLSDTKRIGLRMQECIRGIDRQIFETARAQNLETATTLSALLLDESRFYLVHTGDSRIYRYTGETMTQLTPDQITPTGELASWLGGERPTDLFYNEGDAVEDRFLLCTDGLYKRMDSEFLQKQLSQAGPRYARKTMERLLRYATEHGESDNISLAIACRRH